MWKILLGTRENINKNESLIVLLRANIKNGWANTTISFFNVLLYLADISYGRKIQKISGNATII